MAYRLGIAVIGFITAYWVCGAMEPALAASATEGFTQRAADDVGDERLESKVERRLRMEGRIRWESLKVEADEGLVTLYGIVKSNEERGFAEKAASTVKGVAAVSNKIIVEPGPPAPGDPTAEIEEESRDRVIEGPGGLKDRQIMP